MVNLLVDLRGAQFDADALAASLRSIESAGLAVERTDASEDALAAWIDAEFGGAWSSEAFAGANVVAHSAAQFAGFATYGSRCTGYSWLRGLGAQPGVGLFGPFGVAAQFRGTALGPNLLLSALASLRQRGYSQALIPAVGDESLIGYYGKHANAQVAERFDRSQWSAPRHRTVVLASGSGSNFQSVIDGVEHGELPLHLALLLSNKTTAFALERAHRAQIPGITLQWDRKVQSREHYDRILLEAVRSQEPELILLLGWMHVLDDRFVSTFEHIINIHPAFLPLDQQRDEVTFPDGSVTPAFRGAHAVPDALSWGSRWVGASSHRVTLDADRGPVLVRKPLAILAGEKQDAIMERLHPIEHRVLASGIRRWVYER